MTPTANRLRKMRWADSATRDAGRAPLSTAAFMPLKCRGNCGDSWSSPASTAGAREWVAFQSDITQPG
ncbi:hypothetical protein D3C72_2233030 [compost metagenome]